MAFSFFHRLHHEASEKTPEHLLSSMSTSPSPTEKPIDTISKGSLTGRGTTSRGLLAHIHVASDEKPRYHLLLLSSCFLCLYYVLICFYIYSFYPSPLIQVWVHTSLPLEGPLSFHSTPLLLTLSACDDIFAWLFNSFGLPISLQAS